MAKFVVGIFDDFRQAGDAFIALREGYEENISIISGETEDFESRERITDDNSDSIQFDQPYFSATGGSLSTFLKSFHTIQVSDVGQIFLNGELGDAFSLTPSMKGEKNGGLKMAFIDLGLPQGLASDYANFVIDGRTLIFIKDNGNDENDISRKLRDYGSLRVDNIKDSLVD